MNRIEAALRRIALDLDGLGIGYALIGGFAVSARTEPRFTRDVDLVVVVDDDPGAETLARSLTGLGYGLRALVEQYEVGRLATVRLTAPGPGTETALVMLDLMFASAGIEPEIVAAAERLEILPGLIMPVATSGHQWPPRGPQTPRPGRREPTAGRRRPLGPEERPHSRRLQHGSSSCRTRDAQEVRPWA